MAAAEETQAGAAAEELVFTPQLAPERSALSGSASMQTKSALNVLERELARSKLTFADLLRLRLFLADLNELPTVERMIDAQLGSRRPALSVLEPPSSSFARGEALTCDAVAAAGAAERRRPIPGGARLGPWIFLDGIAAAEPQELFGHMEELLREQGAKLCDVVKVGGWLTFPMSAYAPLAKVRDSLRGRAGLLPASAAVQIGRVPHEAPLSFEAVAFAPERERERGQTRETTSGHSRLATFYADARAVGGYVFTSGEVPDGRGSPRIQAHEVYERLGAHLDAHGASPADVLQQTVFVRAAKDDDSGNAIADSEFVTEAARAFYGAHTTLPSTTLLPVADFGFQPGCAVEIELVARTAGSRSPVHGPAGKQPADAR